ncbi:MAG: hypothetical protein HN370_01780 [Phycisphaerales bacterium]|jgi:hypothetical protein|nr:hypothetical protein [Phycisphaerales bacterium]
MMTKLTLTAAPADIQTAKSYAQEHNTSVSAMFSRFIHGLKARQKTTSTPKRPSTLNEISGIISLGENQSYDDLRREALAKKYGL